MAPNLHFRGNKGGEARLVFFRALCASFSARRSAGLVNALNRHLPMMRQMPILSVAGIRISGAKARLPKNRIGCRYMRLEAYFISFSLAISASVRLPWMEMRDSACSICANSSSVSATSAAPRFS